MEKFEDFIKEEQKIVSTPLASIIETEMFSNGKTFFQVKGKTKLNHKEKDYQRYLKARFVQDKKNSFYLISNEMS